MLMHPGVISGDSAGRKLDPRVLQLPLLSLMLLFNRSPIPTVAEYILLYQNNGHRACLTSAEKPTCTQGLRASGRYHRMMRYPESMTTEGRSRKIFFGGGNLVSRACSWASFISDSLLARASLYLTMSMSSLTGFHEHEPTTFAGR